MPTTGAPHDVCARYLHSDATRVKRPGRVGWPGWFGWFGVVFCGDEMMRGGGEFFVLMVVMCLGVKKCNE